MTGPRRSTLRVARTGVAAAEEKEKEEVVDGVMVVPVVSAAGGGIGRRRCTTRGDAAAATATPRTMALAVALSAAVLALLSPSSPASSGGVACVGAQTIDFPPEHGYINVHAYAVGNHYGVTMAVGEPPQLVHGVVLDTASADLVVLRREYEPGQSAGTALDWRGSNNHVLYVDNRIMVWTNTTIMVDNGRFGGYVDTSPTADVSHDVRALPNPWVRSTVLVSTKVELLAQEDEWIHKTDNMTGFLGLSYRSVSALTNSTFQALLNQLGVDQNTRVYGCPEGILRGGYRISRPNATAGANSTDDVDCSDSLANIIDTETYFRLLAATGVGPTSKVGFDLHDPVLGTNSSVQLGNFLPQYRDRLQWTERWPYNSPRNLAEFPMFHLELCGVDVFGNYSSHWLALVDTGAVCMTLPSEFFDIVMTWTPSRCEEVTVPGMQTQSETRCYVTAAEVALGLPVLSFQASEGGEPLYIPLEQLLLPSPEPGSTDSYYCIMRGFPADNAALQLAPFQATRVSMGTMAMRALYMGVDLHRHRVGFATKDSTLERWPHPARSRQCPEPRACPGAESLYVPRNLCIRAECGLYLLQYYNEDTQECAVSPGWAGVGLTLVFSFGLCELGCLGCRRHVTKDLRERAARRRRRHAGEPEPERLRGCLDTFVPSAIAQRWVDRARRNNLPV